MKKRNDAEQEKLKYDAELFFENVATKYGSALKNYLHDLKRCYSKASRIVKLKNMLAYKESETGDYCILQSQDLCRPLKECIHNLSTTEKAPAIAQPIISGTWS